ncbi:DNA polymerase III subunit delta' [Desulfococcaceae bacterium OttesenSCG-928-F15]|nr:DNA polymerase III subunit delta' [Desulfococcaceae bacterium OttesenSCG-928-F15]
MTGGVRSCGFDSLRGQDFVFRSLDSMLSSGRFPHALLFSGLPGSGRFRTAQNLMMRLNCDGASSPCGECRSCTKVLRDNHPDFIQIRPLNGIIRIEEVRDLLRLLIRKPNEARMRLVFLEDAESMNREAANALLKMLEEPPPSTSFILSSKTPQLLLETIRSRCQELRFRPQAEEDIARKLSGSGDESAARASARLSAGDLDKAERFIATSTKRKLLAGLLAEDPGTKPALFLMAAEFVAQDKRLTETVLDILSGIFRDMLLFSMEPEAFDLYGLNGDCKEEIRKAAERTPLESAIKALERIQETRQALLQNILPRLSLEALFFGLIKN